MIRATALLALALALGLAPASPTGAAERLGEIVFANSGAAAAQEPFRRGLALLHNFEYRDAALAFEQAQTADPGFAMAYWGEAMTFNHPVWMEQDAAKAREVLARLAPTMAARLAAAKTERERAYLHAVETLYGAGSKEDRDRRYAAEMAQLHARFPEDVDATAFSALALLGTAHHGRDVPTYMRAAALLEDVFPEHRNHPGVLHYLIHSYDDPIHAPLGMRAARLYAPLAANAPHALHMTSHIFIALGMWDDVVSSNVAAMQALNAARSAGGRPPAACGHYDEWLNYGYLQERRGADAQAVMTRCRALAAAELDQRPQPAFSAPRSYVASYCDMVVVAAIERGRWPSETVLPLDDAAYIDVRFLLAYGEALTAGSDVARLHRAAAQLRRLYPELKKQPPIEGSEPDTFERERIMLEQVRALELQAAGKREAAIAALRAAGAIETALPIEFGPPSIPKPTMEAAGDALLAAGRASEAAAAYTAVLARAPGRTLALQGLLRAQQAQGDRTGAASTQATLDTYVRSSAAGL